MTEFVTLGDVVSKPTTVRIEAYPMGTRGTVLVVHYGARGAYRDSFQVTPDLARKMAEALLSAADEAER